MRPVSSWGRLSRDLHEVVDLDDRSSAAERIAGSRRPGLPFGNGRSYGDVCLNAGGTLWATRGLDRFLAFDERTGVIECEAGVTLKEVIDVALPRGWFPAVTPGTQFVTVGGAVANDVHGKNHHGSGCFGNHVESLTLLRTDGRRIVCGPAVEPDWYRATVGGLGLTGLVSQVSFRLRPVAGPWLDCERHAFQSLEQFFELSAASIGRWEYTVSWIDCSTLRRGEPRGIFFAGNHVASHAPVPAGSSRRVPFTPPTPLVNRLSLRAFNHAYYGANRAGARRSTRHYRPFFYPLDALLDWNRIYGPRGFYQFQCVVPEPNQKASVRELLQAIAASGEGSFLSVLKTFGPRPALGRLSFPMAGTTLALDFPDLGASTRALLQRLCAIVDAAGGRLYPAKDAFMPASLLQRGSSHGSVFPAATAGTPPGSPSPTVSGRPSPRFATPASRRKCRVVSSVTERRPCRNASSSSVPPRPSPTPSPAATPQGTRRSSSWVGARLRSRPTRPTCAFAAPPKFARPRSKPATCSVTPRSSRLPSRPSPASTPRSSPGACSPTRRPARHRSP